jgi:hypothetical protein
MVKNYFLFFPKLALGFSPGLLCEWHVMEVEQRTLNSKYYRQNRIPSGGGVQWGLPYITHIPPYHKFFEGISGSLILIFPKNWN